MHKIKRFLSILLALVMLMGMLPTGSVFAEDGDVTEDPTTTTEPTEASEETPEEPVVNHVLKISKDVPVHDAYLYRNEWPGLPEGKTFTLSFKIKGHGYVRATYSDWGNKGPDGSTIHAVVDSDEWQTMTSTFDGTRSMQMIVTNGANRANLTAGKVRMVIRSPFWRRM